MVGEDRVLTPDELAAAAAAQVERIRAAGGGVLKFERGNPLPLDMSLKDGVDEIGVGDLGVICVSMATDLPKVAASNAVMLALGKGVQVCLSFDDFDDDPREIWHIPAVRRWCREFIEAGGLGALIPKLPNNSIGAMDGVRVAICSGLVHGVEKTLTGFRLPQNAVQELLVEHLEAFGRLCDRVTTDPEDLRQRLTRLLWVYGIPEPVAVL